jgi:hypothetical protein
MPPAGFPMTPAGYPQPAVPPRSGSRRGPVLIASGVAVAIIIGVGTFFAVGSHSSSSGGTTVAGGSTASGSAGPTANPASPAASTSASAPASPATQPPIGDSCLVGTWKDGGYTTNANWQGTEVPMTGAGGNLDHIAASGTDHDVYDGASTLTGTYKGSTLTESIRGTSLSTIKADPTTHTATAVSLGWTSGSTTTFLYQGQTTTGGFDKASGQSVHYSYICTATTLTWMSDGKMVDNETRVSATP